MDELGMTPRGDVPATIAQIERLIATQQRIVARIETGIEDLGLRSTEFDIGALLSGYSLKDILRTIEGIREVMQYNPTYRIEAVEFLEMVDVVAKFRLRPKELLAYEMGLSLGQPDLEPQPGTLESMVGGPEYLVKPSKDPRSPDVNARYRLPERKQRSHKPSNYRPKIVPLDPIEVITTLVGEPPNINMAQLKKAERLVNALTDPQTDPNYLREMQHDLMVYNRRIFPRASTDIGFMAAIDRAIAAREAGIHVYFEFFYHEKLPLPIGYRMGPKS